MPVDVEDRIRPTESIAPVCATDGMPLYATIVGPRCPLCGGSTPR